MTKINRIDKTCPNCKHCLPDKNSPLCKLGKYSFNGCYVFASSLRAIISSSGGTVYDDRVTAPCGPESLYWEDGRAPVDELGWHRKQALDTELTVYDSPMKTEIKQITPREAQQLLDNRNMTRAPNSNELNIYERGLKALELAAEAERKLAAMDLHGAKTEDESLIDKALKQHSNQDVWGKPFKMAEE